MFNWVWRLKGGALSSYAKEVREEWDRFVVWPVSKKIQLGDFGFLSRKKAFDRIDNVLNLGITPQNGAPNVGASMLLTSQGGVNVKFGSNSNQNQSAKILFNRRGALLLDMYSYTLTSIANMSKLESDIKSLYARGDWNHNSLIVTEVYECTSLTVLISSSKNAQADIVSQLKNITQGISLADPTLGLTLKSYNGIGLKIISYDKNITFPMVDLHRLKGVDDIAKARLERYG
jgi:hypothetical protein